MIALIGFALAEAPSGLALGLLGAYGLVGAGVAWHCRRQAMGWATALGALVCWPLLLTAFGRTETRSLGPLGPRIARSVAALRSTLEDPAAAPVDGPDDLEGLVSALGRADERLALVDRLIESVTPERTPASGALAQSLADLQRARANVAAEVEAVLEGLAQLRIQIGLRSLAGDGVPVRERLRDLRARLAAVDELAELDLRNDP
jgi:hypothetical protein